MEDFRGASILSVPAGRCHRNEFRSSGTGFARADSVRTKGGRRSIPAGNETVDGAPGATPPLADRGVVTGGSPGRFRMDPVASVRPPTLSRARL